MLEVEDENYYMMFTVYALVVIDMRKYFMIKFITNRELID